MLKNIGEKFGAPPVANNWPCLTNEMQNYIVLVLSNLLVDGDLRNRFLIRPRVLFPHIFFRVKNRIRRNVPDTASQLPKGYKIANGQTRKVARS